MSMSRRSLALLSLVGMSACPDAPSYDDFPGLPPPTTSGTTVDSEPAPTSGVSDTDDEQSTEDEPGPTSTTGEDVTTTSGDTTAVVPMDGPPTIDLLPLNIDAAGPLRLEVVLSADVTEYELFQGEMSLGTFSPNDPTFEFPVTSQIQCKALGSFRAVAHDAERLEAEDSEPLDCSLPTSGSEALNQPLPGKTVSRVHAVAALDDGYVVAGEMDDRLTVWRLGPDLEVLGGWPRGLANWTAIGELKNLPSSATAVVVDAAQSNNILVAGHTVKGGAKVYYVARLTQSGSLRGEDQGLPHEEAAGLVVTPEGAVVVAGAVKTSNVPKFDWRVWGYSELTERKVEPWSDTLPLGPGEKPDEMNLRSERARAAAVLPTGEILVVGEREFFAVMAKEPFTRVSWQRYTSTGQRVGPLFTSTKDPSAHDAANAVVVLPVDEFAITGWTRKTLADPPRMLSWHFAGDVPMEYKIEPGVTAEGKGIARDRVGNLVVAAELRANNQSDAWAFAISDWSGGQHWTTAPHGEPGPADAYHAVACNEWGYCLTGGFLTVEGAVTGFVRLHNP